MGLRGILLWRLGNYLIGVAEVREGGISVSVASILEINVLLETKSVSLSWAGIKSSSLAREG